MLKKANISPVVLFLLPIFFSLGLFSLLNLSCQKQPGSGSGTFRLLYTSEVGGKLDPCG